MINREMPIKPSHSLTNRMLDFVRSRLGFLLLVSVLTNILLLAAPLYMLQVYDRVLSTGSVPTLFYLTIICLFLIIIYAYFDALRAKSLNSLGVKFQDTFAPEVLQRSIMAAAYGGPRNTQFLRELDSIRQFISGWAMSAFLDAPLIPIFLLVVFLLHPVMGIVCLLGGIAIFAVALIADRESSRHVAEHASKQIDAYALADGLLLSADYLQASNTAEYATKAYKTAHRLQLIGNLKSERVTANASSLSKFLRIVVQFATLGTGAVLVIDGALSAGGMIAASIIASRALAPVEQSINAWHQFQIGRRSFNQLEVIERLGVEEDTALRMPEVTGNLRAENLGFRFPQSNRSLFSGLEFEVVAGRIFGIVGASGSGKTTLCRLIVGLAQPTLGKMLLDEMDLHKWNRQQRGEIIGYMPQAPTFIDGTVAENICNFQTDADDERVVQAARLCGAHDLITQLPMGYETRIGPRGHKLSGGQTKLIALARAAHSSPRIYVLDEPTAHLDSASKDAFGLFLKKCMLQRCAVLIVTHDQKLAQACDTLLVMERDKAYLRQNNAGGGRKVELSRAGNVRGLEHG